MVSPHRPILPRAHARYNGYWSVNKCIRGSHPWPTRSRVVSTLGGPMAYHGSAVTGAKSSPAKIYRQQRLAAALELRLRGIKLEEIADRLGYDSRSHVYVDIDRGLTYAIREPANQVKALELMRLDALLNAHWDAAMGTDDLVLEEPMVLPSGEVLPVGTTLKGSPPDDKSAAVILKIMERRAKLEGLDVSRTSKLEITGSVATVPQAPSGAEELSKYGAKLMMALDLAGALQLPIPDRLRALNGRHQVLELGVLPTDVPLEVPHD